ncbi:PREDICTED: U3 small nucleolar RNA-interacting protein 2 [Nicrophorus vespilloides]|uniref:U3 small nucleolar RNA-interacting protein 2 n=1 Tax=Nicrophorus vespilloides TaxID=110193 RepID=A0ABM1N9Y0_NICVS|nr:PREDICTED: U3 small nucleolar RNA-interacting protein 2 [Nicrophorus vespilloides]
MSFFIRPKQSGKNFNKKGSFESRKRKAPKKPEVNNDEITSSEDESHLNDDANRSSSEDEHETAQEKKIRLAKIYLDEIKKLEQRKIENQTLDDNLRGDLVQKKLQEDYLSQTGRLKLFVAKKYTGYDENQIVTLRNNVHKNCITCFCISSDNKFMFSGSKDGGLIKWSIEEKKKVLGLPFSSKNTESSIVGHSRSIMSIAISSDNKFLAVGDETQNIQIWNPVNLKHVHTLKGHRSSVTALTFRKDTHTLYSGSKDKAVKVWSLDEMSYVESVFGHMDMITSIDSLSKERALSSGGRDHSLRIWKFVDESQLIFNGHTGSIDCVKYINEGNFVSGGDDGQICVWGMGRKKPLCSVKVAHGVDSTNGQPLWITSIATLVNTDLIASGSHDGSIKLWCLEKGCKNISEMFSIPLTGFVNDLKFTSDGKYLIAAVASEHRYGRWNVIKSAKNSIVIIPLQKN